jgi:GxxExxY protein
MTEIDEITERVIGAAIAVHTALGPGLLESAYDECLSLEMTLSGLNYERQLALPIVYRSVTLLRAYKPDFVIEGLVILELKTIEKILPVHEAQVLTYLKLSGLEAGLLINFNAVPLKSGIRRLNRSKLFSSVSSVSRVRTDEVATGPDGDQRLRMK